ncbi:MAG: polysaccharide deacetylase family protein [Anaerolineae bacterium]
MTPNPVLKRLGLADTDRAVIIHADDIGMCQSTVTAFAELTDFGLISSGAVMVPCAWFPTISAYCRDHPTLDVGVHLTLNCEWYAYGWPPISTADRASGLIDGRGYMWRTRRETLENADPTAVAVEAEAQIRRALDAGIDATHIDSHMFSIVSPRFMQSYVDLAQRYRLPAFAFRPSSVGFARAAAGGDADGDLTPFLQQMEEAGLPLFDHADFLPLNAHEDRVEVAKERLGRLPAGLSYFILHPAADTPEIRALAPDYRSRVADYQAFLSPALRDFVRDQGIHVIGYRALRDLWRGASAA